MKANIGFDSRVFLTDAEHATYIRRMPVRYLHHPKAKLCQVCGLAGTAGNPLQLAHKIPFSVGVRDYKLTPDFLDLASNTVTAHRAECNKSVELSHEEILSLLATL